MNHGLKKQEPFSDQGLMPVIKTNVLPDEVFWNHAENLQAKNSAFTLPNGM
jgi:hypothetical protein